MSGKAWFYGMFFTIVIAIVCGIIGYLLIILNGERLLEEHGSKLEFGEASIIYDVNGNEISRLYDILDHREVADFSEIPQFMKDAIVATEDQRFYEHSGLDFWAIGRALVKDVIARSAVEGGSTITQQLAKNVFLSADKTFFRKATEASIAVALEQQLTKDEILTMYLNRIYFGKGIHGIKAAAEFYFGVELEDMKLWQAATLAAMPKAPNRFNPLVNPDESMNRRAVVLRLMYDQGYITEGEMKEAQAVVYEAPPNQNDMKTGKYYAYSDFVLNEAMKITGLSEEELRVSGLQIYTSLDPQAQDAMDKEFADPSNFEESKDDQPHGLMPDRLLNRIAHKSCIAERKHIALFLLDQMLSQLEHRLRHHHIIPFLHHQLPDLDKLVHRIIGKFDLDWKSRGQPGIRHQELLNLKRISRQNKHKAVAMVLHRFD